MSKYKLSLIQRTAIWNAHNKKCFYSGEYLKFSDMEIDHIIPEWLEDLHDEFIALKRRLGLNEDFQINSFYNWVPVKHSLNRRKGELEFTDSNLRFYLNLASLKVTIIQNEVTKLERQAINERLLTSLAAQIESAYITKAEVINFLDDINATSKDISEPIILSFSVLLEDLEVVDVDEINEQFSNLELALVQNTKSIISVSENENNGETLSIRFVCWYLDLNKLDSVIFTPWILTEVAMYSEVYENDPQDFYDQAIIKTYHQIISDPQDTVFGLSMCPRCGSKILERNSASDYKHDEIYYMIKCLNCGWSDWTQ